MEPIKPETHKEMLIRLQAAAKAMTQEQVEACAWMMYEGDGDWTPENLAAEYQQYIDNCRS